MLQEDDDDEPHDADERSRDVDAADEPPKDDDIVHVALPSPDTVVTQFEADSPRFSPVPSPTPSDRDFAEDGWC